MVQEAIQTEIPLEERYDLSKEARKLLELSRAEAVGLDSPQVNSEHLLLACASDRDIAVFLNNFTLTRDKLLARIKSIVEGVNPQPKKIGKVSFSEEIDQVLSLAEEHRKRECVQDITKFHLLIGLVQEGDGIPASILDSHGILYEQLMKKYYEDQLQSLDQQLRMAYQDQDVQEFEKDRLCGMVQNLRHEVSVSRERSKQPVEPPVHRDP
ncbi:hypothetical protein A3A60_03690 [Candidatus Curtissbacteria bacterium RIFCSPLOWO2_01_FULL_42_26]|uniref:Clp R domain-containing protein n=1 Tax=Candidatus Curtissbacteria bacterium RIFCSPLOWO2_01_FULL_42_26 TaxID=1797729 RepID=A0A1F5HVT9_9BACT|nr:MAG: hypothetical protein A3A60_03690 [Candidatus Curtissbacteria bacterium RIFCSPLOWO2_01_FULL_42_26]